MKLIYGGPPALPGSCYLCGTATRERYIDLEINVEFHGAMYMCDLCIMEMAQELGMISEDQASDLNFKLLALKHKEAQLREEIESLKGVLSGYDDVRNYLESPNLFADSHSGNASRDEGEGTEIPGREGELEGGENGPPEQTDDEGMGELSSGQSVEFDFKSK